MKVNGSYQANGFTHLESLIPPEIVQAFLAGLSQDIPPGAIPLSQVAAFPNLLQRPAFEVYGHHYKPMLFFLWGLTPIISNLVGRDLLPTYDYFRIYRQGDICRVHSDRYSCEHSLSLTIGYSDEQPWNLEVAVEPGDPSARVDEDFGETRFAAISMQVGDAVLYKGVAHRHGRTTPNPNRWSAHLFLHWVDRDGPYREHAFDGQAKATATDFTFA